MLEVERDYIKPSRRTKSQSRNVTKLIYLTCYPSDWSEIIWWQLYEWYSSILWSLVQAHPRRVQVEFEENHLMCWVRAQISRQCWHVSVQRSSLLWCSITHSNSFQTGGKNCPTRNKNVSRSFHHRKLRVPFVTNKDFWQNDENN